MATDPAILEFDAEFSEAEAAFRDFERFAEDRASDVRRTWRRALGSIDASSKKTTKTLGGLNKVAATLGGRVGGAAGAIETLVGGLGELSEVGGVSAVAMGGAGIAIAGAGVAAGVAAVQIVSLVHESRDLLDEWNELAGVAPIPQDTVNNIEDAGTAFDGLDASVKLAKITLAGEFAPAVTDVVNTVSGLTLAVTDADSELRTFIDFIDSSATNTARGFQFGTFDAAQAVFRFATGLDEATEAGREHAETIRNAAANAERLEARERRLAEAAEARAKAEEEADKVKVEFERKKAQQAKEADRAEAQLHRENERRRKERQRAREQEARERERLQKQQTAAVLAAMGDQERAQQEHADAMAEREREAAERAKANAQLMLDLEALQIEANRERFAFVQEQVEATAAHAVEFAQIANERQQDIIQRRFARNTDELDKLRRKRRAVADEMSETTNEQRKAELKAQLETLKGDIDTRKKRARNQRSEARRLFKGQKRIAQAEVAFNTAAAIIKAFAMFGPPPSPVGIAAAATAGASGLAQSLRIRNQRPPTFAGGGMVEAPRLPGSPDHVVVGIDKREAVLRRSAVDRLGGKEAVDALNEDRAMPSRRAAPTMPGRDAVDLAVRAIAAAFDERAGRQFGQAYVYGAR